MFVESLVDDFDWMRLLLRLCSLHILCNRTYSKPEEREAAAHTHKSNPTAVLCGSAAREKPDYVFLSAFTQVRVCVCRRTEGFHAFT